MIFVLVATLIEIGCTGILDTYEHYRGEEEDKPARRVEDSAGSKGPDSGAAPCTGDRTSSKERLSYGTL